MTKTPRLFSLLACAAFFLCFGHSASAGQWKIIATCPGADDVYVDSNALDVQTYGFCDPYSSGSGSLFSQDAGTLTVDFYWIPDPNNANDAPPSSLHLQEFPEAYIDAYSVNAVEDIALSEVTVDDGFGDPPITKLDLRYGEDEDGAGNIDTVEKFVDARAIHLVTLTVDNSTGTVPNSSASYWGHTRLSCEMNAQALIGDSSPYGQYSDMSAGYNYELSTDSQNRSLAITCPAVDTLSNGGSQYRDPPLTGSVIVNVRQSDGTLRGDTLAPLGDGSYTYGAFVNGAWGASGTTYHWYGSISSSSASGTYAPLQNFDDTYLYGAFVGQVDHIFLSMYDGSDSAEATANYYMHFHYQYEPASWPLDARLSAESHGARPRCG